MTTRDLEIITGDLRAYKELEQGTFQHVDELMNARREDPKLRRLSFYTADGQLYFMDNGVAKLAITREQNNPLLNNLDNALSKLENGNYFSQLINRDNYTVSTADFEQAVSAEDTVLIDLTALHLSRNKNYEYHWLKIDTSESAYKKLNAEERKLAKRVYGQGDDFTANMQMLRKAGISETNIYVLNPEYVQKHAETGVLGRTSWLEDFEGDSDFFADYLCVNLNDHLHGVRANEINTEVGLKK